MSKVIVRPRNYRSVKTLLKAGKRVLQTQKWGRGAYLDSETGQVCAVGALKVALYGLQQNGEYGYINRDYYEEDTFFPTAFGLLDGLAGGRGIIHWNDTTARSVADVIRMYDKAIEYVETK